LHIQQPDCHKGVEVVYRSIGAAGARATRRMKVHRAFHRRPSARLRGFTRAPQ
jgi:hypothetical protein